MKKNKQICAAGSPESNMIQLTAELDSSDLTHVQGVAYSGGFFRQPWSERPCVTDLAGLEIASQIVLMYNHCYAPECKLGEVRATKTESELFIDGGIDTATERGKRIVDAGKKCEWQLSHGAEIIATELVPEGETRHINGKDLAGPFLHITKAKLREVSVVAIGADSDTRLRIAAGLGKHATPQTSQGGQMNKKLRAFIVAKYQLAETIDDAAILAHLASVNASIETMTAEMAAASATPEPAKVTPAKPIQASAGAPNVNDAARQAVADERARVSGVRAALAECPTMVDKAIDAGWSVEYCTTLAAGIKAATAGMQQASANIVVKTKPQTTNAVLEAALEFRAGVSESTILKAHGEQATAQADKLRGISLHEALIEACHMRGINTGVTLDRETITAGLSTTDLPVILSNVAHKAMMQEFDAYPIIATRLCSTGDLVDYKEAIRVRMTDVGGLEVVPVGGEVPNSQLGEESATNKAERYAKSFWLDEQLIVNDDLGMFLRIPKLFGAQGARLIDQIFFQRLLANPTQSDNKALFHADHGNYLTGTTSALSLDGLKSARVKFLQQTDMAGNPISIAPKYLLVPSALEALAQELVMSALIVTGENASKPNANVISKWGLEVISAPYLDASNYANHSTTGWYLFANSAQVDTFEIGYLKGKRVPSVERGQFDLSHFGIGYRVRFDFGIREQDHRGMVFNKGVN